MSMALMNENDFYEDSFAKLLTLSPEVAAELGVQQIAGHRIPQDGFSDISVAGEERRRALMARMLVQLRAFQGDEPGSADDLNRKIYEFFLRWGVLGRLRGTESHRFPLYDYVADHLVGVQTELITCLSQWQPLETAEDAEAFLSRVAAVPAQIDALILALRVRSEAGNNMPWCIVRRVLTEIDSLLSVRVDDNPIYRRFAEHGPADQRSRLVALLEQGLNPAYVGLREFLSADYPREERVGVFRFRNGGGYYDFLLKAFTTTDLSAGEIHAIGREQIGQLQQVVAAKLHAAGYAGNNLIEQLSAFDVDQDRRSPRVGGDEGRRATQALVETIIRDTESRIRPLFGIWPRSRVIINPVPAVQEANRQLAYMPPSTDGSRPGSLDLNLSYGDRLQLYTLAYHEAVPGHHVQLSVAQELGSGLPSFRRVLVHDGFIEGWAKYAEVLPWMEGLNTDVLWDISRSRNELFSTANLVVDTGIHHLRWSREQAVAFFERNTGCDSGFSEFVVDRAIARPAQLCAYKLGMMTVLAARDRMQKALGDRFDIRRFHDVVLGQGSVPLAILDSLVDAEIARERQC